ncbi:MAG: hypothetical protein F6K65_12885 [Moorea sp. SIO3C2]|nr:hypothetical protein [Moorena sp. SIO3C2]
MKILKVLKNGMDFKFAPALKVLCALLVAAQLFLTSATPAIAQPIGPCVVSPQSICTRDLNPCGNPSQCLCPPAYSYDASVGSCMIDDINMADGPGKPVEGKCSIPPQGICTADINVCGQSSICKCPGGTEYSALIGSCVIPLPY